MRESAKLYRTEKGSKQINNRQFLLRVNIR